MGTNLDQTDSGEEKQKRLGKNILRKLVKTAEKISLPLLQKLPFFAPQNASLNQEVKITEHGKEEFIKVEDISKSIRPLEHIEENMFS